MIFRFGWLSNVYEINCLLGNKLRELVTCVFVGLSTPVGAEVCFLKEL